MIQPGSGPKRMVLMGCDRLGGAVATMLAEQGHSLHILDPNVAAFERLPQGMIEDGHIVPLVGDGTDETDLRRASIQEADVFMALSGRDTSNALAAQVAKQLFRVPTVICRIDDPTKEQLYRDLGIVAVGAVTLVSQRVAELAIRGTAVSQLVE